MALESSDALGEVGRSQREPPRAGELLTLALPERDGARPERPQRPPVGLHRTGRQRAHLDGEGDRLLGERFRLDDPADEPEGERTLGVESPPARNMSAAT